MRTGIIAAGHGERLRPAGLRIPKPLVAVEGRPLIDHVLHAIAGAGLREAVCIINEESGAVEDHCRQQPADLELTFVRRTTPNSMESLFTLAPYLGRDPFLLLTVDVIMAPDTLRGFLATASRRAADGVLAVHTFIDDEKPLRVVMAADGRIREIGGTSGDLVTAGMYLVPESVRAMTPPAGLGRLRDFLQWLARSGAPLYGEIIERVVDVDRADDVALAESLALAGRVS